MELFNKALEQSEACLGVLTLDNDSLVVDVNDSYIVMTGFKRGID